MLSSVKVIYYPFSMNYCLDSNEPQGYKNPTILPLEVLWIPTRDIMESQRLLSEKGTNFLTK